MDKKNYYIFQALGLNETKNIYDATNHRISNIADPIDLQDTISLSFLNTSLNTIEHKLNNIKNNIKNKIDIFDKELENIQIKINIIEQSLSPEHVKNAAIDKKYQDDINKLDVNVKFIENKINTLENICLRDYMLLVNHNEQKIHELTQEQKISQDKYDSQIQNIEQNIEIYNEKISVISKTIFDNHQNYTNSLKQIIDINNQIQNLNEANKLSYTNNKETNQNIELINDDIKNINKKIITEKQTLLNLINILEKDFITNKEQINQTILTLTTQIQKNQTQIQNLSSVLDEKNVLLMNLEKQMTNFEIDIEKHLGLINNLDTIVNMLLSSNQNHLTSFTFLKETMLSLTQNVQENITNLKNLLTKFTDLEQTKFLERLLELENQYKFMTTNTISSFNNDILKNKENIQLIQQNAGLTQQNNNLLIQTTVSTQIKENLDKKIKNFETQQNMTIDNINQRIDKLTRFVVKKEFEFCIEAERDINGGFVITNRNFSWIKPLPEFIVYQSVQLELIKAGIFFHNSKELKIPYPNPVEPLIKSIQIIDIYKSDKQSPIEMTKNSLNKTFQPPILLRNDFRSALNININNFILCFSPAILEIIKKQDIKKIRLPIFLAVTCEY